MDGEVYNSLGHYSGTWESSEGTSGNIHGSGRLIFADGDGYELKGTVKCGKVKGTSVTSICPGTGQPAKGTFDGIRSIPFDLFT